MANRSLAFFRPAGFLLLFLMLFGVGATSCTRVDVGHVGIQVSLAGSSRGVQNAPIVTGWVFYNPVTEDVIEFPTSIQNRIWGVSRTEGAPRDESITFASREGVSVNADVAIAYHIEGSKAPRLYARFRQADITVLTDGYIRNLTRDMLNEVASTMTVQEIYGPGKTTLLNNAQRRLNERLNGDGFMVDQLSFTAALTLPSNVVAAINASIGANQEAVQAQNRVAQVEAEARQNVARAEGVANAARAQARGEADAQLIRARAEAEAREIVAASQANAYRTLQPHLTPEILRLRQIDKWNGALPAYSGTGASVMLPPVPAAR